MADEEVPIELDPPRLAKRMEWERFRAGHIRRGPSGDSSFEGDFTKIVFPDADGLRHAARVIAGIMAGRPDEIEATREILEILAIPKLLAEGGDGRPIKEQIGPVRFGRELGTCAFSVEIADEGKPKRRPKPDA